MFSLTFNFMPENNAQKLWLVPDLRPEQELLRIPFAHAPTSTLARIISYDYVSRNLYKKPMYIQGSIDVRQYWKSNQSKIINRLDQKITLNKINKSVDMQWTDGSLVSTFDEVWNRPFHLYTPWLQAWLQYNYLNYDRVPGADQALTGRRAKQCVMWPHTPLVMH